MIHIRHLSDVTVSRNWYKTVSNLCGNPCICNFYKSCKCETDHIQQIQNQSKNDYIPQEPENLRFAPVIVFNFDFAFWIDIIDNIIAYSPYRPYYVTRTSANDSAVFLSRDTDGNHVTSPFKYIYRYVYITLQSRQN